MTAPRGPPDAAPDVLMLAVTGGRERTLAEYRALLDATGLTLDRLTPTATPFSIAQARIR